MIFSTISTLFLGLVASTTATPILAGRQSHDQQAPARTVYQFANGSWVENIAVRSNGNLLVTRVDVPELHEIDPSAATPSAKLVHRFDTQQALLGISEVAPDVFAIAAGNYSLATGVVTPGSFAVWTADLSAGGPQVTKATAVADAGFLNGLTTLDAGAGTVLVSDSFQGSVRRVDVRTGATAVVLADAATMGPPADGSSRIGVNGVRYCARSGYLYYVNLGAALYCRVPIDPATGQATGAYEVLATGVPGDDFALDETEEGVAYVALGARNEVGRVEPSSGQTEVVVGGADQLTVAGATSAQFGRAEGDQGVLYVTTSGHLTTAVNGLKQEGGKVVAVDVGNWKRR